MTSDDTASGQTVGEWLEALGSVAPAPGGGAASAMNAAVAAALVEMVCNLTIGKPKFAEHEAEVTSIRDTAATLRRIAVGHIDADAAAFTDLMAAYRLPRDTAEQKETRRVAIEVGTRRAATVPLDIAGTAAAVIALAVRLPGRSNPNVLSDVGVAAAAAAAAIDSAVINVEVNLATLPEGEAKTAMAGEAAGFGELAGQARALAADVLREVGA